MDIQISFFSPDEICVFIINHSYWFVIRKAVLHAECILLRFSRVIVDLIKDLLHAIQLATWISRVGIRNMQELLHAKDIFHWFSRVWETPCYTRFTSQFIIRVYLLFPGGSLDTRFRVVSIISRVAGLFLKTNLHAKTQKVFEPRVNELMVMIIEQGVTGRRLSPVGWGSRKALLWGVGRGSALIFIF